MRQHSLDRRQFLDFRQSTLPDGQRIIDAYNASGLHFTLLPDRGLDIWTAHFKGRPLTWISAGSPHPADFGRPWLALFNGGLLTTCGLTHVGPPETDTETGEARDFHGNYTRLRATRISLREEQRGDTLALHLSGSIHQGVLYGHQLSLARTYTLDLNTPSIALSDTITNLGDANAPLMLLYHCNLGFPLIHGGTTLQTAGSAYPFDELARQNTASQATYAAARPHFEAQVFVHHLRAGVDGWTQVALLNDDFGLAFAWDTDALPYLTQWKNTRAGIYVSGVEPGNCIPEGRNNARQSGRLKVLGPGQSVTTHLRLTALEGAALTETRAAIEALTAGTPVSACQLDDFAGR
jgi:hypothetical protein